METGASPALAVELPAFVERYLAARNAFDTDAMALQRFRARLSRR